MYLLPCTYLIKKGPFPYLLYLIIPYFSQMMLICTCLKFIIFPSWYLVITLLSLTTASDFPDTFLQWINAYSNNMILIICTWLKFMIFSSSYPVFYHVFPVQKTINTRSNYQCFPNYQNNLSLRRLLTMRETTSLHRCQ